MIEFSSHSKFANDLVKFVMDYFKIEWQAPVSLLGQRLPLVRFTDQHAALLVRMLKFEPYFFNRWKNHSLFSEMDENKFVREVLMLRNVCRFSASSVHNFLFYSTLVAIFAVFSMENGFENAPDYAVAAITSDMFDVGLKLTRSSWECSSRTVS